MGAVENVNKEVKNLLRTFTLYLKDVAGVDIHTTHALVPWLVRHIGWILCVYRVRSDGRTGYERLKGRPYGGRIAAFGECLWYRTPDAFRLSSLDARWTTAIWLGKSWKTNEHIIAVGNDVRLARSVRRKITSKRFNRKMLQNVLVTPWKPRLEPTTQPNRPRRYITKAYITKYGPTPECGGCVGRTINHSDTCKARFLRIFEEEDRSALSTQEAEAAAAARVAQPASNVAPRPETAAAGGREFESAQSGAPATAPAPRGAAAAPGSGQHRPGVDSDGGRTHIVAWAGERQCYRSGQLWSRRGHAGGSFIPGEPTLRTAAAHRSSAGLLTGPDLVCCADQLRRDDGHWHTPSL